MPESIHEAVKRDLDARAARGLSEYGVPLTRDTPGLPRHLYEELLDAACYLRAAMEAHDELARLRAAVAQAVRDVPYHTTAGLPYVRRDRMIEDVHRALGSYIDGGDDV